MSEDRQDRLWKLTAEAARSAGHLTGGAEHGTPAAGDLYVLPETADLPVEWLVLDRAQGEPDRWLAVPADTNPLRGPGDLWIGPDRQGGPLSVRCRFDVALPGRLFRGRGRTGRVSAEDAERALETVRDHRQGTLDAGPLADEVAADPEYRDWERGVLGPARAAVATLVFREPAPEESRPGARVWISIAAALALLSIGLGAWNLGLRQRLDRLSAPILIGDSQEVGVGSEARAPAPLRVRPGDQRQLVFIVLSDEAADFERYRVVMTGDDGTALWTSPDVERPPVPELTLVIPGWFLDGPNVPTHLVVLGVGDEGARALAEIPILVEKPENTP